MTDIIGENYKNKILSCMSKEEWNHLGKITLACLNYIQQFFVSYQIFWPILNNLINKICNEIIDYQERNGLELKYMSSHSFSLLVIGILIFNIYIFIKNYLKKHPNLKNELEALYFIVTSIAFYFSFGYQGVKFFICSFITIENQCESESKSKVFIFFLSQVIICLSLLVNFVITRILTFEKSSSKYIEMFKKILITYVMPIYTSIVFYFLFYRNYSDYFFWPNLPLIAFIFFEIKYLLLTKNYTKDIWLGQVILLSIQQIFLVMSFLKIYCMDSYRNIIQIIE